VNQLLQTELELEQPSLRFSKNVMEQLHSLKPAPATNQYINKSIIRGIAVFFIVSIVSFLIYGFTLIDWSSQATTSNTTNYKLPAINYSALFSSTWINVIMMIAVIMGLMLMDGYLRRNRKAA
jgi:magnesium-transporting ATPase (P-type)